MTEPDLPRILCPTCSSGEFNFPSDDSAQCPHCSATFPVEKGILKLLPESPGSRSLAQIFMEWDPLIHIYEGTLWRKNPLFTYGLFGISFKEEFEEVVNAAGLSESEVILDLACGPGIYSRPLAKKLKKGSVTGLDLSLPMLKYAVSHAGNEKIDNFIAVHGNALNLPFSVDQFDAVICCGAFHLFPDHERVLAEIRRILKPRGRFVAAVFYRRVPGSIGEFLAHMGKGLHGIHPLRPDWLEHKLLQAGFSNIKLHHAKRVWMIMSGEKSEP